MRDRVPSLLAAFLISSSFSLDLLSLGTVRSLAGLVVTYHYLVPYHWIHYHCLIIRSLGITGTKEVSVLPGILDMK